MPYLSIDARTYRRLAEFATVAGISIHAAATEVVDNWMDLSNDPRLAVTALSAITVKSPGNLPIAAARPRSSEKIVLITEGHGRAANRSPQHRAISGPLLQLALLSTFLRSVSIRDTTFA